MRRLPAEADFAETLADDAARLSRVIQFVMESDLIAPPDRERAQELAAELTRQRFRP